MGNPRQAPHEGKILRGSFVAMRKVAHHGLYVVGKRTLYPKDAGVFTPTRARTSGDQPRCYRPFPAYHPARGGARLVDSQLAPDRLEVCQALGGHRLVGH